MIGDAPVVAGFALAGARVYPAETPAQVHAAWQRVAGDRRRRHPHRGGGRALCAELPTDAAAPLTVRDAAVSGLADGTRDRAWSRCAQRC